MLVTLFKIIFQTLGTALKSFLMVKLGIFILVVAEAILNMEFCIHLHLDSLRLPCQIIVVPVRFMILRLNTVNLVLQPSIRVVKLLDLEMTTTIKKRRGRVKKVIKQ